MIEYSDELFGLTTLSRVHGSAVYRAVIPALFSTSILVCSVFIFDKPLTDNNRNRVTGRPFVFSLLIGTIAFLITYRANFSYQRYWESATGIHLMLSKWFDACADIAVYHYQSSRYKDVKPPAYGQHPDIDDSGKARKRMVVEMTQEEYQAKLDSDMISGVGTHSGLFAFLKKSKKSLKHLVGMDHKKKSKQLKHNQQRYGADYALVKSIASSLQTSDSLFNKLSARDRSKHLVETGPPDCNFGSHMDDELASPLLQKSAHLFSLLSAVAMATLRNDIPGLHAPLVEHEFGLPFPPADPDKLGRNERRGFPSKSRTWTALYFILGLSRSDKHRTLYNHSSPFQVLGGISDGEIKALRQARGPSAKVSLCFLWIHEFMSREHLNHGLGDIHPAILSRCYQFASDGMRGYHACRKVAQVPFPFAEAQLTIFFIAIIIFIMPLMFYSFVNTLWLAALLNFSTVLCFYGLQEVATELESPNMHVPNNLPLTTFQAQFNEAIIATWAGYHPDSGFDIPYSDLPNLNESNLPDLNIGNLPDLSEGNLPNLNEDSLPDLSGGNMPSMNEGTLPNLNESNLPNLSEREQDVKVLGTKNLLKGAF